MHLTDATDTAADRGQPSRRLAGQNRAHPEHHHGRASEKASRHLFFSPQEVALVAEGGRPEGELATALLAELTAKHRVAYVKEESDASTIDGGTGLAGRAARNGASPVWFGNETGSMVLLSGALDRWNGYDLFNEADIVLVEGRRDSTLPKIAVLGAEGTLLDEIERGSIEGIIACVLPEDASPRLRESVKRRLRELPLFEAKAISSLAAFLLSFLDRRARSVPLYGLVLGGGLSTRMKRDKAAIDYRGEPQVRYVYRLLEQFCERVFVSNRSEQANDSLFDGLEQIHDRFLGIGPMGGMLSAFHTHPEAAWLVLGCDLPFVDEATLTRLVAEREPLMLATCYLSAHDGLPEPLCALYEPRYRRRLHQFLADGRDCPRKALINSRAKQVALADPAALDNINSPEDYERAAARIRREVSGGE